MQLVNRESNIFAKWWFSLDHVVFFLVILLLLIGVVMVVSASPAVALRIGVSDDFFYMRHFVFVLLGFLTLVLVSALPERYILKLSIIGFIVCFALLVLVLFHGNAFKGAKRWLDIFGFSIQPSEAMKPFFIILNAWFFARARELYVEQALKFCILSYLSIVFLLIMQPDFGMVINYTVIWGSLLFLYGIPILLIILLVISASLGIVVAYHLLPHVKYRIDLFLFSGQSGMSYQVRKSLESIESGGFFGQGIGEGKVKHFLPDAHTDFIFAAMVEELGMVFTIIVISVFAFIIIRSLSHALKAKKLYMAYAIMGLTLQFAFQVITNIGVNLNLLPTKGTTLPLISYGGSAMLSMCIILGFILALSREKYGHVIREQI